MITPIFIKNKFTGGHFALQTKTANSPFTNPMSVYRKLKLQSTDIVVDIGAYVGEYSLFAINQGVKKVIAYEPTPNTFTILCMNQKPNMEIYNCAVIGSKEKTVNLYLSKGIGVTNSTTKIKKEFITVPAILFDTAVKTATIVKIDCEGAEYSFNLIQKHLRGIIIEFHPLVNTPWKKQARQIMQNIESVGFTAIHTPQFKHGWDLTGCWVKN